MKKLLLALLLALGLSAKSQSYTDSVFFHGFLMDSLQTVIDFDSVKIEHLYILYNRSDDVLSILDIGKEIENWTFKLYTDIQLLVFEAKEILRFDDLEKKKHLRND